MANVLAELFANTASAIREKTGDSGTMKPAEFPEKIRGITTGSGVGKLVPLTVTENGTYAPNKNFDTSGGTYRFKASYTQEYLSMLYAEASEFQNFPMNDFATAAYLIDNDDEEANALVVVCFVIGENNFYGLMKSGTETKFWVPVEVATALGQSAEGWYTVLDATTMAFEASGVPDYPIVSGATYVVGTENIASLFECDDFDGYSSVDVNVSKNIVPITITENGTYDVSEDIDGYAPITVNVGSSDSGTGGGSEDGEYEVIVYDYDGTILMEGRYNTGDVVTLPSKPYHSRLIFDSWIATADVVDDAVTVTDNDILVGATYYTASGATEFDVVFNKTTGLTLTFSDVFTGTTSVDWGDGTVDTLLNHTYADYGEYTIKFYGTTAITGSIFGLDTSDKETRNGRIVHSIRLSRAIESINGATFYNLRGLKTCTIPDNDYSDLILCFQMCYSLTHINVPCRCLNRYSYMFRECYALRTFVVTNGKDGYYYIGDDFCRRCQNLEKVVLPEGLKYINQYYSFSYIYGAPIKRIVIPKSATEVCVAAFKLAGVLEELDFSRHTSVPTSSALSSSDLSTFLIQNQNLKIIVPSSLYDSWITATGWKDVASLIYPSGA